MAPYIHTSIQGNKIDPVGQLNLKQKTRIPWGSRKNQTGTFCCSSLARLKSSGSDIQSLGFCLTKQTNKQTNSLPFHGSSSFVGSIMEKGLWFPLGLCALSAAGLLELRTSPFGVPSPLTRSISSYMLLEHHGNSVSAAEHPQSHREHLLIKWHSGTVHHSCLFSLAGKSAWYPALIGL